MPGRPPSLRLGFLSEDGIAPGVFALIERGATRRPELAREVRGLVELRFSEGIADVQVAFGEREIVVEDAGGGDRAVSGMRAPQPDLVVAGRLPDVISLTTAPTVAGLPSPIAARGRQALGHLARGRVRVSGDRGLARRLMALMAFD